MTHFVTSKTAAVLSVLFILAIAVCVLPALSVTPDECDASCRSTDPIRLGMGTTLILAVLASAKIPTNSMQTINAFWALQPALPDQKLHQQRLAHLASLQIQMPSGMGTAFTQIANLSQKQVSISIRTTILYPML